MAVAAVAVADDAELAPTCSSRTGRWTRRSFAMHLPPGLPLDLYEGQAWLGVVPFRMTNVAPRFVPAIPLRIGVRGD